ncbi:MAG UNVERIFIED_CONTAM: DUF885 domain-containing protein [Planctomycetaceae bacterium]|jgi:hypothetical protein
MSARFLIFCAAVSLLPMNLLQAQTADQRLEQFFADYLETCFQQRPLDATLLGDHRFDDRLDDISTTAQSGVAGSLSHPSQTTADHHSQRSALTECSD